MTWAMGFLQGRPRVSGWAHDGVHRIPLNHRHRAVEGHALSQQGTLGASGASRGMVVTVSLRWTASTFPSHRSHAGPGGSVLQIGDSPVPGAPGATGVCGWIPGFVSDVGRRVRR